VFALTSLLALCRLSRMGSETLKSRSPWPTCRVFVKRSTFVTPRDPMTPIIMIGPGTGIAPMRAILQYRAVEKQKGPIGPTVLFFGCRHPDEDFIYEDELLQYCRDGVLSQLPLAFSRETSEKVYVQHRVKEHGKMLWDLIYNKKGYIYVCG
ncbi:ATR1, partial [Symbiodinium sp. KB8]